VEVSQAHKPRAVEEDRGCGETTMDTVATRRICTNERTDTGGSMAAHASVLGLLLGRRSGAGGVVLVEPVGLLLRGRELEQPLLLRLDLDAVGLVVLVLDVGDLDVEEVASVERLPRCARCPASRSPTRTTSECTLSLTHSLTRGIHFGSAGARAVSEQVQCSSRTG